MRVCCCCMCQHGKNNNNNNKQEEDEEEVVVVPKEVVEAVLNIPNLQAVVLETFGSGNGPANLARNESLAASGTLMVEQDAIGCVQAVGLTVVDGGPVAEQLGHTVRTQWMKDRGLGLR